MKKVFNLTLVSLFLCCTLYAQSTSLSRDKATNLLNSVWMRDPYIVISPEDNKYYLTYTNGKMEMPVWNSDNLVDWEKQGEPYTMKRLSNYQELHDLRQELNANKTVYYDGKMIETPNATKEPVKLWAPEIHYIDGSWYTVHTTNARASVIIKSDTPTFEEFEEPFVEKFGMHHDPYIFQDDNGDKWLVDKCAEIIKFDNSMTRFDGKPIKLNPADRKMGHEGCQIIKVGGKYIWFGTAWSTDTMRDGTYNLHYAVADNIEGPYSERRFAGYCLGHGTVFKDKDGNWWCTAFRNGEATPSEGRKALSINKGGLTLVPMTIEVNGDDVKIEPNDPAYRVVN